MSDVEKNTEQIKSETSDPETSVSEQEQNVTPPLPEQSEKAEKPKNKKKLTRNIIIVLVAACIVIVIALFATTDLRAYNKAVREYNNEEFKEAESTFKSLGDYKDSKDYLDKCKYELSVDGQFMRALKKGLQKRWSINDSDENEELDDDDAAKEWIDAELDSIGSFKNKTFDDSKLQDAAKQYIEALNDSKKSLAYYNSDYYTYTTQWENAYNKRTVLIKSFVDDYGLKVDDKYQDDLDDILDDAKTTQSAQADEDQLNSDLEKSIKSIQFTAKNEGDAEFPYYSYFITFTNKTQKTFKSLNFDVNVKDENGNIIDTGDSDYSSNNLSPGKQVTLDVYFDNDETDYSGYTIEYVPHYGTTDGLSTEF